uniref:Putative secreted protein n=1 Tax=Panstrongylus lignarius TaxID=156445 RepID=A0A224Y6G1_9HEMI
MRSLTLAFASLTPYSKALARSSRKRENRIGLKIQPCLTPLSTSKKLEIESGPLTADAEFSKRIVKIVIIL